MKKIKTGFLSGTIHEDDMKQNSTAWADHNLTRRFKKIAGLAEGDELVCRYDMKAFLPEMNTEVYYPESRTITLKTGDRVVVYSVIEGQNTFDFTAICLLDGTPGEFKLDSRYFERAEKREE
jgi:hypothetical protein